ncbi:hypothetical protein PM8797T_03079 [Gimesia maris DSM 8797]|nr:hypothetical protein PM8797T_03079 [Gimesia maris DSM 8797]
MGAIISVPLTHDGSESDANIPAGKKYHRNRNTMIAVHYDHLRGMIPVKTERFRLVHRLFSRLLKGVNYWCEMQSCTELSGAVIFTSQKSM